MIYGESFTNRRRAKVAILSVIPGAVIVFGCGALIVCALLFGIASESLLVANLSFTVTGSERVCTGSKESVTCEYRVYTVSDNEAVEVFVNRDNILFGKVNSADFQAIMRDGARCSAVARGVRIPLLSQFRNLYEVKCSMAGARVVMDSPGKAAPFGARGFESLPASVRFNTPVCEPFRYMNIDARITTSKDVLLTIRNTDVVTRGPYGARVTASSVMTGTFVTDTFSVGPLAPGGVYTRVYGAGIYLPVGMITTTIQWLSPNCPVMPGVFWRVFLIKTQRG